MKTTLTTSSLSLDNQDFNLWVESTLKLLQQKRFDQLDIENLISEVESLGNNDKKAIKSNLRILLMHLLKWLRDFQFCRGGFSR